MKIILFSNSLWSIYNFRSGLIKYFIKKGLEVEIIAPYDKYFKKVKGLGCKIFLIKKIDREKNLLKFFFLFFKILKILKKRKPDFVLSYTIKPNILSGICCSILKIPNIVMITGLGYVFTFNSILSKILIIIYRVSLKNTNYIFFQNEDDLKFFKKNKIIKNKFAVVPGSGVDTKEFSYKKYPTSKNINFLLIARNIREKGINEFAIVAKQLKDEIKNITFTYVGFVKPKDKTFIEESFFLKLKQKKIIKFIKQTNNIIKHIKESHCLVLPTYREGTPRSILEGFSMGRPAIVTKVIGTKNLISNGKNGFYCKVKNIKSLKKVITKFYKLPLKKKSNMGSIARKIALRKYDEKILISKYWKAVRYNQKI
jgi:glycosyltransferase involved in cell wall biosynthesis